MVSPALALALLTAAPEPTVVAVFDLEPSGVALAKDVRAALDEYLFTKVASAPGLQVVPRAEVKRRLDEAKAESYKECYDQACQIEIGKELAAQKTVSTKLLKLGESCLVSIVVYDLRSAATEGAGEATGGCGTGALIRSLESAAKTVTARYAPTPAAPAPTAVAPVVIGVEDPERCPGGRRIGEPPPAGQSITCVNAKGQPHGAQLSWYPSGQLAMKASFREGKMDGEQTVFQKDGHPAQRGHWAAGLKTGEWSSFGPDGAVYERGPFERGMRTGVWKRFDRDGKLDSETRWRDDLRHGLYVEYHPDGSKEEAGEYEKDKKTGLWTEWSRDGVKRRESHYRADRKHGVEISYSSRGLKERVTAWADDKRHGVDERWGSRDGAIHLQQRRHYADGELHGDDTMFTPDGDPRLRFVWVKGKKQGPSESWSGKHGERWRSEAGEYANGQKTGLWQHFDAKGDVMREETWVEGKKQGPARTWNRSRDGVRYLYAVGQYQDDKMHGEWRHTDSNGKALQTRRYERGKELR
jgi:antitoxin component YwqK of YwqJK toxin-antitoxin module